MSHGLIVIDALSSACWEKKEKQQQKKRKRERVREAARGYSPRAHIVGFARQDFCSC
jgi:hypothetical protein